MHKSLAAFCAFLNGLHVPRYYIRFSILIPHSSIKSFQNPVDLLHKWSEKRTAELRSAWDGG